MDEFSGASEPILRRRTEDGLDLPYLVWRFPEPRRVLSSAVRGGGLGEREWLINASVSRDYARLDPAAHIDELAKREALTGAGVGLLTAVMVDTVGIGCDADATVWATVGIGHPTWAAADDENDARCVSGTFVPGTINLVAELPVRLDDAALAGAIITMTEAKTQAIMELGYACTGTASDAVAVVCRRTGVPEPFAGPRSHWGSRLARAVRSAIVSQAPR